MEEHEHDREKNQKRKKKMIQKSKVTLHRSCHPKEIFSCQSRQLEHRSECADICRVALQQR